MARAAIVITSGLIVMVATRAAEADVPSHLAHPGNPGRRSCQWRSGHDATLSGLDDDERLYADPPTRGALDRRLDSQRVVEEDCSGESSAAGDGCRSESPGPQDGGGTGGVSDTRDQYSR